MIDLGTLGGTDSEATAVNSNGQVVGYADTAAAQHATLWQIGIPPPASQVTVSEQGVAPNGLENNINCSTSRPVNARTGEFWHTYTDASIPGRGVPLDLTRTYNSADATVPGPFGDGWTDSYNMSLSLDTLGNATVTEGDGSTVTFLNTASGFQAPTRVFATLVTNPDGTYTMSDTRRGISYNFSATGQLISESDRNGYLTQLTYASRKLSAVTDPSGRKLTFSYNSSGQGLSVTDPMGRTTQYSYDSNGDLVQVTDPLGRMTSFTYDNLHRLLTTTDPRGGVTTNTYDTEAGCIAERPNGPGYNLCLQRQPDDDSGC